MPGGYQNTYNDNMLVVVMLETLDGILNADEIADTFGVDVVIQGNNDLSRFSGWSQTDPRYQSLLTISRNATLHAGKYWGNAGQQYLTGNPLSADVRFVQNGPAMDGWTPPARGAGPAKSRRSGPPMDAAAAAAGVELLNRLQISDNLRDFRVAKSDSRKAGMSQSGCRISSSAFS